MKLTDLKRFRVDKKGKLILQVEEKYYDVPFNTTEYRWRDARVEDITRNMKLKGVECE